MSRRRRGKVRLFAEPKRSFRKQRKVPKALLELRALQQELAKHNRYTRIRKGKDGCYFLDPTAPPIKRDAFYRSLGTGHIQN